uniref:Transmembrane protein 135 N-terminal domain-containing protein n=1 Tax=Musca domestica TaxID=7370 RepID=A0A1I8NKV9_MUSDO
MTRFSKIFVELIGARTCQELAIHPESCFVHCLKDIPLYLLSNFKYFVPICLLPLLIKLRSLNKNKLRHTFKYYAECSLVGAACGCGINALICFLRYIFGHFGYTTIVYWPSVIGGCLYNLGSERVKTFFETSVFQCITETFFLKRHNFVSHLIADSKYLQTYIFMICSALILQGKYLYGLKGFWFLQPNPKIPEVENTEHTTCQLHPKISCQRYLGHGMRKYFFLGLTLDVIKAMLSRISKSDSAKFKIYQK